MAEEGTYFQDDWIANFGEKQGPMALSAPLVNAW